MERGSRRLETVSHVVFIVACATLTLVGVGRLTFADRSAKATEGVHKGRLVTSVLQQLPAADQTVLVFVNSTCRFCTSSMPFYLRLIDAIRSGGRSVRSFFASREPVEITRRYLDSHHLLPDAIITLPNDIPLTGTPTVLVIDRNGSVADGWLGQLTPRQEAAVMRLLFR